MIVDQNLIGNSKEFSVACCTFYEHSLVQTLLGPSFHPGGLDLTKRLGKELNFTPKHKILDLASGLGSSAITIAEEFGSTVIGIDMSNQNVIKAQKIIEQKHLEHLVAFKAGIVEKLPFEDENFDFVICECSFCLFNNKKSVVEEIQRVLKSNGKILITDMAIEKQLPIDVHNIIFQVACIASAVSMNTYAEYFKEQEFEIQQLTGETEILLQLIDNIKKKLFVLELAKGLHKITIENLNIKQIKEWIELAKQLLHDGYATYMIMIAQKTSFN